MVSRNLPTGRKRGRPKKAVEVVELQSDMSSKDMRMKCTDCGKISYIQTSNPELYTEELRKTWICLLCKCPK